MLVLEPIKHTYHRCPSCNYTRSDIDIFSSHACPSCHTPYDRKTQQARLGMDPFNPLIGTRITRIHTTSKRLSERQNRSNTFFWLSATLLAIITAIVVRIL